GADIIVTGTGRNPDSFPDDEKAIGWKDVESTAEQVRALGRRAMTLVFDVTDQAEVQAAIDSAVSEMGRIDILINNAAVARGEDRTPVDVLDPNVFQRVLDVKVRGTFLCTQAFIKQVYAQNQGGKIVNVSSVAGKKGSAETLAYNAANFAVVGMTQSMAREFGPRGVNVNCVCPGLVATSRMDAVKPADAPTSATGPEPVKTWGTDEDVGSLISYLCTEASAWIHGQSINQCGGRMMEH
ncbi:MAG: SDR family oxidoreductase, partial [Nitrospina sp.]|nr:SDR family oxidoreductase [Nitrospina sp.]